MKKQKLQELRQVKDHEEKKEILSNLSKIISLVDKSDDNLKVKDHDKVLTEGALSNYLTTNATENS